MKKPKPRRVTEIGKRYLDPAHRQGWDDAIEAAAAEAERAPASAEEIAHRFHFLYEQTAPEMGYSTRMDTRAWDPKSANGRLMIRIVEKILPEIRDAAERIRRMKRGAE